MKLDLYLAPFYRQENGDTKRPRTTSLSAALFQYKQRFDKINAGFLGSESKAFLVSVLSESKMEVVS